MATLYSQAGYGHGTLFLSGCECCHHAIISGQWVCQLTPTQPASPAGATTFWEGGLSSNKANAISNAGPSQAPAHRQRSAFKAAWKEEGSSYREAIRILRHTCGPYSLYTAHTPSEAATRPGTRTGTQPPGGMRGGIGLMAEAPSTPTTTPPHSPPHPPTAHPPQPTPTAHPPQPTPHPPQPTTSLHFPTPIFLSTFPPSLPPSLLPSPSLLTSSSLPLVRACHHLCCLSALVRVVAASSHSTYCDWQSA